MFSVTNDTNTDCKPLMWFFRYSVFGSDTSDIDNRYQYIPKVLPIQLQIKINLKQLPPELSKRLNQQNAMVAKSKGSSKWRGQFQIGVFSGQKRVEHCSSHHRPKGEQGQYRGHPTTGTLTCCVDPVLTEAGSKVVASWARQANVWLTPMKWANTVQPTIIEVDGRSNRTPKSLEIGYLF